MTIPKNPTPGDAATPALSPLSFYVTQQKGTEAPFRNRYWDFKEDGIYHCIVCATPLFDSSTKFDSGTGWPSFFAPVAETNVHLEEDHTHGMTRTEVCCRSCGAHLGHVFDDAPHMPTGQRYCMNSASLQFAKRPTP